MRERRRTSRKMAHPKRDGALRRAVLTGLGVPVSLLLVTSVVRATGLPLVTSSPHAGSTPAVALASATHFSPAATSSPTSTPTPTPTPTAPPTPTLAPTAAPTATPALVWSPSGSGHVTVVNFRAPWTGTSRTTAQVSIYTPPGYDPNGDQQYPVIYEAPTGLTLWSAGMGVADLDSLIDSGAMPAAIVVFIDEAGVPISPSECVDSADGEQWFETYVTRTVVGYVDNNYRTIRDPRARATMGMSEGGFCAAMLVTRHPDLFSVSMSFSGYYWAGTPAADALVPFGGKASLIDAYSPALLVPKMSAAVRASLFFIVVANWSQGYFGPQATAFDAVLKANGFAYLAVNSPYPHGWPEVQTEAPGALKAWGAHLKASGV